MTTDPSTSTLLNLALINPHLRGVSEQLKQQKMLHELPDPPSLTYDTDRIIDIRWANLLLGIYSEIRTAGLERSGVLSSAWPKVDSFHIGMLPRLLLMPALWKVYLSIKSLANKDGAQIILPAHRNHGNDLFQALEKLRKQGMPQNIKPRHIPRFHTSLMANPAGRKVTISSLIKSREIKLYDSSGGPIERSEAEINTACEQINLHRKLEIYIDRYSLFLSLLWFDNFLPSNEPGAFDANLKSRIRTGMNSKLDKRFFSALEKDLARSTLTGLALSPFFLPKHRFGWDPSENMQEDMSAPFDVGRATIVSELEYFFPKQSYYERKGSEEALTRRSDRDEIIIKDMMEIISLMPQGSEIDQMPPQSILDKLAAQYSEIKKPSRYDPNPTYLNTMRSKLWKTARNRSLENLQGN